MQPPAIGDRKRVPKEFDPQEMFDTYPLPASCFCSIEIHVTASDSTDRLALLACFMARRSCDNLFQSDT
jgi:hypothetical protein